MIVTKIEKISSARSKVYINEKFAFVLYKGELSEFHIKENSPLDEDQMNLINEKLTKRAKLRAMHLLESMGRTEEQLRKKLQTSGYPDTAVEEAIRYVKSFGYINDDAYIYNFAESRKNKKSRREICASLMQKGLGADQINRVLDEIYENHSERSAIEDIIRKKRWDIENADFKEKSKMEAYLVRKGFKYDDIKSAFSKSEF